MRALSRAAFVLLTAGFAGCATLDQVPSAHVHSSVQPLRECAQWYQGLDADIDSAGVRDAQDARIGGFPYLRIDRLLASFRETAAADDSQLRALVERMRRLDRTARRVEVSNIPAAAGAPPVQVTLERAEQCAAIMREADLNDPVARATLIERLRAPDSYSLGSRIVGLYALTRIPFGWGVKQHQDEVRAAYARESALAPGVSLMSYSPPPAHATRARVVEIIAQAASNPLGIPDVAEADLRRLDALYAPDYEIEVAGDYDRFGALYWTQGTITPMVNTAMPTVYRHVAWTRYRGRTLLQLVYTIWFSERPPASNGDILAGQLDGITWRVTLAPDGEPLIYDTMHPCGCYHMFFPTPRARPLPAPDGEVEFMFSPQSLPRIEAGKRPRLRIATRTHYIERVSVVGDSRESVQYQFGAYDDLRSLPRPTGGRASIFGSEGLVAGSERPERFLFWPMGIESAGAMRQWGRHATAFVGRRHFDDADLLEKRFILNIP